MATGKRIFRVAVSYTVAVEADCDMDAIVQAQYTHPFQPSVRRLTMNVLSSWVDKPKEVELPQAAMPTPLAERESEPAVESVHDAAAGEQLHKDSDSSTFRDPAPVDDITF